MARYAANMSETKSSFCAPVRYTSTTSIAIQYSQFSSFMRTTSQVAKRLVHVVTESRNGQAAPVSAASHREEQALRIRMPPHAKRCTRAGQVVTRAVDCF